MDSINRNSSALFSKNKSINSKDIKHNNAPVISDNSSLTGTLNDLLRQQLTPKITLPVMQEITEQPVPSKLSIKHDPLTTCLIDAVSEILNAQQLDHPSLDQKLQLLFDKLYVIYQVADIPDGDRTRQFISPQGLILSPENCVTTQKDCLRVRAFMRGIHQAITELKHNRPGSLHIAYPACGPFAPLLLPLIGYYKALNIYDESNLQISLIDIQPGAVTSLEAITHELGITDYIHEVTCQDACQFQSRLPIDIVVIEAMQHGLSREGHLAIARHFASIIRADGIFLPQEICLRATLNFGQREYVDQWADKQGRVSKTEMSPEIINERIELGDILRLTADSLRNMQDHIIDKYTRLIDCNEVTIPPLATHKQSPILLICTEMITYGHERIGEYDSGITHPLPDTQVCINFKPYDAKPGDLLVNSGDKLKFYYRLNGLPGFMATTVE
jgi:hypothetical protein